MGSTKDNLDKALGIDIDKLLTEDDDTNPASMSTEEIDKYNKRREAVDKMKQELKDARSMNNKVWSEALLKRNAEKLMVAQEIFSQEIEDNPCSKNVTAISELSNALTTTVHEVLELEREDTRIAISKEKNDLRKQEIEGSGKTINASGKSMAIGTNADILRMIKAGVEPTV